MACGYRNRENFRNAIYFQCASSRKTFADRIYHHFGGDLVKTQCALGHRCIESTAAYISFR